MTGLSTSWGSKVNDYLKIIVISANFPKKLYLNKILSDFNKNKMWPLTLRFLLLLVSEEIIISVPCLVVK